MSYELDISFLEQLCRTASLSGNEQEIQKLIYTRMEKYSDKIETDILGNVYAIKNPNAPYRIMVVAHCDEVGFRANYIDDNGFIYMSADYGADHRIAPGKRVSIMTSNGPVIGVVGRKARALQEEQERKVATEITNMWIDIGCKTREEAAQLVKMGDPVMYGSNVAFLQNNLVSSRALDDKIGVFIAMESFRLISPESLNVGIYCVSSVQEEAGLRGAQTAAFRISPHCGIVIDVTDSSDIPGVDPRVTGKRVLGGGPVLVRGPNVNESLVDHMHKLAHEKNIPAQVIAKSILTGTDARVVQVSRTGVSTALISIPLRYMHLPSEVGSMDDVRHAINLIIELFKSLPAKPDFRPLAPILNDDGALVNGDAC